MTTAAVTDAVIIGAGIVGAACADHLARAGVPVAVVERGGVGHGTTGSGEGNILVSDKGPGPELQLAMRSLALWRAEDAGFAERTELEAKGGVVVAMSEAEGDGLARFATAQRAAGVLAEPAGRSDIRELEPHLTVEHHSAMHYPQDMQVQPVIAASAFLSRARAHGATVMTGTTVTGVPTTATGAVRGVDTDRGRIAAGVVVDAAGTWSDEVARLAGTTIPVAPRRGVILVTAPVPQTVWHKVYDADYVGNVASDERGLQLSSVIEGTRGGTILIGASRELVGFDPHIRVEVIRQLAARAIRLFPVLAGVQLLRAYRGYRPYTPDHLPIIGSDPDVPGLIHATGHEGAGVGLAPATGELVAALVTGAGPAVDAAPFRRDRPALLTVEERWS